MKKNGHFSNVLYKEFLNWIGFDNKKKKENYKYMLFVAFGSGVTNF